MSDRLAVLPQYFFPKQALTVFAGWVAGRERGWVTTEIIRRFVAKYQVNMAEALDSDIASYPTFNAFFTRALKPGARPLADADLVCPVDGAISQFGHIDKDQIFQAKGHHYSTTAVLGGDAGLAAQFEGGHFATIYLSPKDYHRIHMPCDGTLRRMIYVPGELFSVNPTTARGVPGLFARNERGSRVGVALGLEYLVAFDGAELADRTVDRADQVGVRQRPRAGLERAGEKVVEALVAGDVGVRGLVHVDAVLGDEAADQPGGARAPLARRAPAGITGQRLLRQQVLGQHFQAVGHGMGRGAAKGGIVSTGLSRSWTTVNAN